MCECLVRVQREVPTLRLPNEGFTWKHVEHLAPMESEKPKIDTAKSQRRSPAPLGEAVLAVVTP
eukprot:6092188-Alexandrium_andersonii.AAC.1